VKMSGKATKMARFIVGAACMVLFSGHLGVAAAGVIKGETIEEAVSAYVGKNTFWPEGVVRVEFPGGVSDVSLSGERIACRVQSRRNEDFIGNTSFTVRFYEDDELLGKQTVRARLEVLMDVVVSSRSLRRNTEIGSDDVRVVKRWFARPPVNVVSSPEDVVGKKLRASIKPNTEITGNMVRDIPVVHKGKPVKIVVENGLMGVTTIGMSEQDGMRGELIKVRNLSSKKIIYARVMDDSLVKVEF
jgi:flagella basal body P-ring formation protein FlgA